MTATASCNMYIPGSVVIGLCILNGQGTAIMSTLNLQVLDRTSDVLGGADLADPHVQHGNWTRHPRVTCCHECNRLPTAFTIS